MKLATKFATVALGLLLTHGAPLAHGESPADETRLTLRQQIVRLINRDRAAYGLRPVALDVEVSLTADRYCVQQIRNRTSGHFTTDALTPYMRYSFAGGNDGVSENAAAWSATYRFTDQALYEMIRRSHEAMMAELPPHDGHRRTILDPHATHVGVGLAWEGGEFRLTQEFVRRYLDWKRPLPRAAAAGEPVTGSARPLPGYHVAAISVHHEPLPQAIAPVTANRIESYGLPGKRRDYLPRLRSYYERAKDGALQLVREEYANGHRGDFPVAQDGAFIFSVPFADGPGVYTVVVWVQKDGTSRPIAASNVSIRIDPPAQSFSFAAGGTR